MKKLFVYSVIVGLLSIFIWFLNNPNPALIEKSIERMVGADLPSDFEIVNYSEGGLNDYTVFYEIRLSKTEIEELLSNIDRENWEKKSETLYEKTVEVSAGEHFILFIDLSDQTVYYKHLRD